MASAQFLRLAVVVAVLIAAGMGTGCTRKGTDPAKGTDTTKGTDGTKGTGAANPKDTDAIVAAVRQRISSDPNISSKQIQVSYERATPSFHYDSVVLRGTVSTDEERTAAENDAIKVTDVGVVNHLGVARSQTTESTVPDAPPAAWSDSGAADKPSIPLCPGLTIVTAIASLGDCESIKTIESVSPTEARVKYTSEVGPPWWTDPRPQAKHLMTTRRTVLTTDLKSAHRYDQIFVGTVNAPETAPGTTAIGTSAAVLRPQPARRADEGVLTHVQETRMKRNLASIAGRLVMAVAAIPIISAQIASAQDFTVQMKDEAGKIIATHYVSRNAVRNVSSTPADSDMIYRLDTGTIITVNHKQKTYSEIVAADMRQLIEKKQSAMSPQQQELMRRFGYAGAASVTKIGPAETIAGYATEKYSAKTPMTQGEIWVAPALEVPPGYYDMLTSLAGAEVGMGQIFKEIKEKQIKGFLLKSVTTVTTSPMMKGMPVSQVATSVEKGPIPASTFEPPAGYQKVARGR
jgi:hypothetical protein